MIPRLDRYVLRFYLSSWLVTIVFFVGLYGVFDFFQHVDDLVDEIRDDEVGLSGVALLYLVSLPVMIMQMAPFMLVTSALVTVMRLVRHNEFMAMVMIGRTPQRVVRPVLVASAAFVLLLVIMQEFIAPSVSMTRDRLKGEMLHGMKAWTIGPISMRDADGRLVTATEYDVGERRAGRLNVSFVSPDGADVFVTGSDAEFDGDAGGWRLVDGTLRRRDPDTGGESTAEAAFVETDVDPEALMAESLHPFDMSYAQLLDLSRRYPTSHAHRYRRHYHVTFPIALLLLVLLGLRFVLVEDPSQRIKGLGRGLLACVLFMGLDAGMARAGGGGSVPPVLAAWAPVIVGGSLVVVFGSDER